MRDRIDIIVSSEVLKEKLNQFDFTEDSIKNISMENDTVKLYSIKGKSASFSCHVMIGEKEMVVKKSAKKTVEQYSRRWDWIKSLVNAIEEQPIVVQIHSKNIRISIDY